MQFENHWNIAKYPALYRSEQASEQASEPQRGGTQNGPYMGTYCPGSTSSLPQLMTMTTLRKQLLSPLTDGKTEAQNVTKLARYGTGFQVKSF